MKFDLPTLLAEKTFSHPSIIRDVRLADGGLRLTVAGYSWWAERPAYSDEPVILSFSGISSGSLDLLAVLDEEDDEALGDFEIELADRLEWARPKTFSLYCSQPLPEPLAVHAIVERWVQPAQGVRGVGDFLHGAEQLSTFLTYAASQVFLLASGPDSLCPLLVGELGRQGVRHQISSFGTDYAEGRYFVRLAGGTWFFCDSATLEIP